ncbi:MAG: GNAT family N-acetyltransferase [Clostridia bacterium]|nr:GNAT family N-acetyltransferase [Clostridia bacterium]
MEFTYKTADISALNEVLEIYSSAQKFMEANGNPQWVKGFPDKTDIAGAIYGAIIYTVLHKGEIVGVFAVVNYDGNYDYINGSWLTSGNYLAVHRVATKENFRKKGVAKFIVEAATEIAKKRGRTSLRFDTHEKNIPMQNLLNSCGFTQCGTVLINRDGTPRLAYEKII